jgi:ribosome-binding ATPase
VPGELRQADALLAVLDGFSDDAVPTADLETLRLELIVADRDHVERRLERARKEANSGDRAKRQEVELTERLLAHLDEGRPLSDWPDELPSELEPLTTKPLIALENGPSGIDCALEMELSELPPDEAAEFRSGPSALDDVVLRLKEALGLITFFTVGDTEARSWTLQYGQTALEAAESIHTDIARGFIRCEVIRWDDLLECGSHAEAARRGLQRLEGKTYVVEDGDVLNIRFNVYEGLAERASSPGQRLFRQALLNVTRAVDAARGQRCEPERGQHDEDRRKRPKQALVGEVDRHRACCRDQVVATGRDDEDGRDDGAEE